MTTINRQPLTPAERADLRQRCDQADRGWHDDVQIFVSRRVLLALLDEVERPPCEWREDEDGNWHTGCGHLFFFDTDGPTENKQKFCGYCGGALHEVKLSHD